MRYSEIIVYRRQGDYVIPMRVTKAHGIAHEHILDWAELYGNHTSWIAADIEARAARLEAYARAA